MKFQIKNIIKLDLRLNLKIFFRNNGIYKNYIVKLHLLISSIVNTFCIYKCSSGLALI
jgi:hypothetical protein